MDPADMNRLGLDIGGMVEVIGKKTSVCKLLPTFKEHRGKERLQIDGIVRENVELGIGESAVVRPVDVRSAVEVVLDPQEY